MNERSRRETMKKKMGIGRKGTREIKEGEC